MIVEEMKLTKLTIRAKSSSGEPYDMDFLAESGRLSVYCNCKAGIFGQLCKHKTEFIAGDESRLFDVSKKEKMTQLSSIADRAPEIRSLSGSIVQTEKRIRQEQARLKTLKKQFAAQLQEGIAIAEDTQ